MEINDRPWGKEEIIVANEKYAMKRLFIKAGHRLSKQFHTDRDKTVYVHKGTLQLDLSRDSSESNIIYFEAGDTWRILPRVIHRFSACGDHDVELLEVSTPNLDDVYRLSDDYGRPVISESRKDGGI